MARVDSETSTSMPAAGRAPAGQDASDRLPAPDDPPPAERTGDAPGPYAPTGKAPEELFEALGRLRREAESEIERLIDLLDDLDDDPDAEPTLGSADPHSAWSTAFDQRHWGAGARDDREGDPGCDDKEPNLCGLNANSGPGDGRDLEGDDSDLEPLLGWTDDEASRGRAYAGSFGTGADLEADAGSERELDYADSGIGDMDGLMEQVQGYGGSGTNGFARFIT